MRLKPKTVRRLLLLSVALLLIVGAGVAVVVVRNARNESRLIARREAGFEAAAAGEHVKVVHELGAYLRRRPADADALLAWARARRFVEARDGKHLIEAASVYQRYLAIQHDDQVARRELLQCLADAGLDVEVIDVARQLRPADLSLLTAEHLPYIRHEIDAHRLRREYDVATILLARRAVEIAPEDFGLRIRYGSLLAATNRTADAESFVEASEKAFPEDPRVELIRIVSGLPTLLAPAETLNSLAKIVGVDPQTAARTGPPLDEDEAVLAMIVSAFTHLGRFDLTLSSLEPRARSGDLNSARTFARRALYSGEYTRLIELQADSAAVPAWNSPDTLGLTAMALASVGRQAEAQAMFEKISKAPEDFRAASWRLAKDAVISGQSAAPLEDVKALRNAIEQNPMEPLFRARLATILLDLGRIEEARTELTTAARSPLAEGWARLGVLEARTFLAEDRVLEARKVCEQTLARFPTDSAATALMLSIRIELLDRGYTDLVDTHMIAERLAPTLELLSSDSGDKIPDDLRATLIAGIAVAAERNGDTAMSRAAVELATRTTAPFPAALLSRLVSISRERGFGLESTLIERAEQNGPTPASVRVRAVLLDADSKRPEAIELIRREAAVPPRTTDMAWQILLPTFLDSLGDPGTAQAWKDALARIPDNIDAHRIALQSRGVARDPDLINSVAERIEVLAGTKGDRAPMMIRLARARALASADPSDVNRDQLLGLLRAIVNEAPDMEEPRLLLVNTLLAGTPITVPNAVTNEALSQLRAATTVSADPAPIRLRIADLLRRLGSAEAARVELVTVASDTDAGTESRWAAVEELSLLGYFEQAAAYARNLLPDDLESLSVARSLDLGRIFTLAGLDDEARRVYTGLAKTDRALTPEQAFQVASGFAFLGHADAAHAVLDRTDADPAVQRELQRMQARVMRSVGEGAKARELLNTLIESDPDDVVARCLLIESLIEDAELEQAQRAIDDARKGRDPHPDVELLAMQLQFRGGDGSITSLDSLADLLDKKPEFKERAAAVRAYAALRMQQAQPSPMALRELSMKFADEPTVQSVIIGDLLRCAPPAVSIASDISLRASRRFPASWQLASDVVRVHMMAGNWPEVLNAAERWQRLNRSRAADLAIGEAQLQLGRPRLARTAVQPHVEAALRAPEKSAPTLRLWCAVLVAERQVDEARKLLEPHLQSSPAVLNNVWIPLAAYTLPPDTAVIWLRTAAAPAAAHGPDSCFALANAWFELALRDKPTARSHLAEARTLLNALTAASPSPRSLLLLGRVAAETQDLDSARTAFLAAAEFSDARADALRGLAVVAIARTDDPAGALAAARLAVEASGPDEPMSMRLLGDALIAAAEAETDPEKFRPLAAEAVRVYGALLTLSGESLMVLDRIARAAMRADDVNRAIEAYERLVALPASSVSAQQLAATQNNFACALMTRTDHDSLQRARQLAIAASGVLPVGAVFDTLGAIEAALGNRTAAVDAFKQSLRVRPDAPATAVKLAELLAPGNEAQRDEARQLVASTDAALAASPSALAPELLERFQRVRDVLGKN